MNINLELGLNLLDKALSHYREALSAPGKRSRLSPELVEQLITKIVGGSDFLNATRFLREFLQAFAEGAYSQELFGTALNILISKQQDFIRFDTFDEKQRDIEKNTQNREIVIIKALKNILLNNANQKQALLPEPVLVATLYFFRAMLELAFKEKPRSYIDTVQSSLVADGPALPNYLLFQAHQNSKTQNIFFEPIPEAFETLSLLYKTSAQKLISSCTLGTNPQIIRNLQLWLFTKHVKKAKPEAR